VASGRSSSLDDLFSYTFWTFQYSNVQGTTLFLFPNNGFFLGCLRNPVNTECRTFFTSVHSVFGTELAKIPWNYTEFRFAEE
jgi:hypothetical protein